MKSISEDTGSVDSTYTFEQLKNGDFEGIIHGSGPLWTISEAVEYREAFPDTKPFLVRTGVSLSAIGQANRYTMDEKLEMLSDYLENYFPDELHFLTITYVEESHYEDSICRDKEMSGIEVKEHVKKVYGEIAQNQSSCGCVNSYCVFYAVL